jgi:UDP-glucose 4-epimerase
MSKYLVTGGAGFIGSALANRLIENGGTVTIIDNLSTGFKENIPANARFIEGDCQDYKIYKLLNEKFDVIYHIAGQSSGEISFDDPVYDLQTNTQSTLLLLNYAIKTGCKRFLYASSMSVYGDHPDIPISEDKSCNPKSFYGVGKMASEHYLRLYQEFGIQSTALRLFNVYGPGQNMANMRQGMVSIFLEMAIKNKHIIVKGNTNRFRDFIFIDDVVDTFVECENNSNTFNKVYNVATGVKTNIKSLLKKIIQLFNYKITIEIKGSTPGDQFGIYADINSIRKDIDREPEISIDVGLKKMFTSVVKNE